MHKTETEFRDRILTSLSSTLLTNGGKLEASFCRQVAAWVPDMFCNFNLMKNHKIANNSTTSKAR